MDVKPGKVEGHAGEVELGSGEHDLHHVIGALSHDDAGPVEPRTAPWAREPPASWGRRAARQGGPAFRVQGGSRDDDGPSPAVGARRWWRRPFEQVTHTPGPAPRPALRLSTPFPASPTGARPTPRLRPALSPPLPQQRHTDGTQSRPSTADGGNVREEVDGQSE